MKWDAGKIGDVRWTSKFALLPTKLNDKWIWFEKYIIAERLTEVVHNDDFNGPMPSKQWLTIKKW